MKLALLTLLASTLSFAQALTGDALIQALQKGGFVIVMRHTSSPRTTPTKETAKADNLNLERQLDENGQRTATAMGEAFRKLRIPVGDVLASPTYRARETVKYAQFGIAQSVPEIGDNGESMGANTETQVAWLRNRVKQTGAGTNTILVTHQPNLTAAFPQEAQGVADGEALIFGTGGMFVGRVKVEDWPKFVK